MLLKKLKQNKYQKGLFYCSVLFLLFVLVIVSGTAFYNHLYNDKIFPKTIISSIDVSGLTFEEAQKAIQDTIDIIEIKGIEYKYRDISTKITPTIISTTDIDASYRFINFYVDNTIEKAFLIGREKNIFKRIYSQINSYFKPNHLSVDYFMNESELINILKTKFTDEEKIAKNASFNIDKNHKILIQDDVIGIQFDYKNAISNTKNLLNTLNIAPIELKRIKNIPEIRKSDIQQTIPKIEKIISQKNIILKYNKKDWVINNTTFQDWLAVEKVKSYKVANLDNKAEPVLAKENAEHPTSLRVVFNKEDTSKYLNKIAESIDIKSKDAKFVMENGRVVEFETSHIGRVLNIDKTLLLLNHEIIKNEKETIELVVEEKEPEISTANANEFGIKEIIGVGISDFKYSPKNRVHNINVGANTLHGLLIKPDEEFSLIKTLGRIDGAAGYKKELVIKGDETTPEFGGGLCQIGTTTFRAALASGLPITERRNHSYRVSYYEPAGTDATIYNPKPDFKFKNDTGNYILIQTKILDGHNLVFEFWGTRDGRIAEQTDPIIYNIKPPPPKKEIETDELEPGEVKCTERAHNGANAKFDYKVTYPDGQIEETTFRSHYIPWQEVCLIGIDPEKKKQEELEKEKLEENEDDSENIEELIEDDKDLEENNNEKEELESVQL